MTVNTASRLKIKFINRLQRHPLVIPLEITLKVHTLILASNMINRLKNDGMMNNMNKNKYY